MGIPIDLSVSFLEELAKAARTSAFTRLLSENSVDACDVSSSERKDLDRMVRASVARISDDRYVINTDLLKLLQSATSRSVAMDGMADFDDKIIGLNAIASAVRAAFHESTADADRKIAQNESDFSSKTRMISMEIEDWLDRIVQSAESDFAGAEIVSSRSEMAAHFGKEMSRAAKIIEKLFHHHDVDIERVGATRRLHEVYTDLISNRLTVWMSKIERVITLVNRYRHKVKRSDERLKIAAEYRRKRSDLPELPDIETDFSAPDVMFRPARHLRVSTRVDILSGDPAHEDVLNEAFLAVRDAKARKIERKNLRAPAEYLGEREVVTIRNEKTLNAVEIASRSLFRRVIESREPARLSQQVLEDPTPGLFAYVAQLGLTKPKGAKIHLKVETRQISPHMNNFEIKDVLICPL